MGDKDLVFVDINTSTGLGNAPQKVARLKKIFPNTPIVVMHGYTHARFTESLVKAGANGILSITPSEEKLREAVTQVMDGNTYDGFTE
ncbi:hypothetical protein [Gracilimonas mengyeensis]|nr:hypothetical protein [Gracilimonas mengyeensis]